MGFTESIMRKEEFLHTPIWPSEVIRTKECFGFSKRTKKTLQVCICWRNKIWYPTSTHPFESPSRIRSFFTKSFTLSSYRDCNCFFCNMNQFFIIYVLHLNLESTVQEKLRKRNAINSTKNEPQTNRNKSHVYNKILKKLTVSIWFK